MRERHANYSKRKNIFSASCFVCNSQQQFSFLHPKFFLSSELGFKMHISIKHQVASLEGKFSYKFSFKSYTVIDYICGGEKKSSNIAPRLNEEPVYFMLLKPKMNKIILNVLIHQ